MLQHNLTLVIPFHFPSNKFLFRLSVVFLKILILADMASKRGYDVEPISVVGRSFECQICLLILRDPVQLSECGHRFCKLCMNDHIEE